MIFRFEFRRQQMNTLVWTAVISAVLLLLVEGFYPIFLESRAAMEQYVAAFPPELALAFGFDLDDLFGYESFLALVYLYESVLGSIAVSSAALAVFGREKQNHCQDFLLTKPLGRAAVFAQKLLCCLAILVILNVPYVLLSLLRGKSYLGAVTPELLLSVLCLPLTQLLYLSFGAFLAAYLRRIRPGLAASIGIFSFLLSAVHSLTEKAAFRFFSPLFYYSPNAVRDTGGYDPACVATAVVLTVGLLAAAAWKTCKTDIAV